MHVTTSTVSLTVNDVEASSRFLQAHFGYEERMAADGFCSLGRDDAACDVVFLRKGIEVLPEGFRDQHAEGVILAFTVSNIEAEEARVRSEGVPISMALREEAWGEKLFQVTDPNGVIIQLVEWSSDQANG